MLTTKCSGLRDIQVDGTSNRFNDVAGIVLELLPSGLTHVTRNQLFDVGEF
jgi:hypothetical protein